jgi:hypothetical protein
MKTCSKCLLQKSIIFFNKTGGVCKECNKIYRQKRFKKYYQINKEKLLQYDKIYRKNNKEKIKKIEKEYRKSEEFKQKRKIRNMQYYQINKEKILSRVKEYNQSHKEEKKIYDSINYQNNKEEKKRVSRLNYENNKEKYQSIIRKYRESNKEKISLRKKEIRKQKLKEDPFYIAVRKIRGLVETAFKRIKQKKPSNTEEILGCSFEEAKRHIESLFTEGMSWENHGRKGWHIDHIKPICSFTLENLHLANHYKNLQPLWAKDNFIKGKKIIDNY